MNRWAAFTVSSAGGLQIHSYNTSTAALCINVDNDGHVLGLLELFLINYKRLVFYFLKLVLQLKHV